MSDPSADIAKVLISEEEIRRRVGELAAQVQSDFAGRDLVVVGLLTGTLMFLADLVREIDLPLRLDFIGVSSYGDGTESRELVFTKELKLDVANRDVLLVDDILDTGKTLRAVINKLGRMTPSQVRTCVLLSKKARREYDIPADYIGFEIPDDGKIPQSATHRCAETGVVLLKVLVKFWSYFRDHTGCAETALELAKGTTLGETHAAVLDEFPKLAGSKNSTLKAVGLEYEDDDFVLSDGDEISFFPPVQGG